ncbi:MAG: tripartite tricarboxylate transporter substrate binding protein [Rhodobacteraceae bacterium]|nr:MAG: tripartite tricarboxylate transporter substrate binding protein [Paracoccaceae bacterium]
MNNAMTRRQALAGAAAAAGLAAAGAPARAAGWAPNRPVEMVIMAGQGGGADRLARFFQTLIQQHNLSPMPMLPVNKGGGSGAEALRYLKDQEGNPHVIMATLNSLYTTPLQTDIGVDITEFTPLARMAVDTFALWVRTDSGIETLDDYIEAVKAADGSWRMGGTGSGQEDSLVTAILEQAFGIRHNYIPMGGGGDVARNLVGGHIESTVNNPSEALSFERAGRVRAIAAFTEERISVLPDTPTFTELGYPLLYDMQRSFIGPANMPAEAVAWYQEMFTALSQTPEWVAYAEENALVTDLLMGDDLMAYFVSERERHAELLSAMEA